MNSTLLSQYKNIKDVIYISKHYFKKAKFLFL